jgi:hypothetical protein
MSVLESEATKVAEEFDFNDGAVNKAVVDFIKEMGKCC